MSLRWSAHISWLFGELPYTERVGAAWRAGLGWIETAWPAPAEHDGLARALAEHGVRVALLNCDAGDVLGGERGFINDPARREEAERAFVAAAQLAQRVGARELNVLVGREIAGVSRERQLGAAVDALRAFAEEARTRGLGIALEPLNELENPGYLAPTPEAMATLIEQVGSDAVGLLLDVYHVARAGGEPAAAIERHAALIRHVQLADFPGRGQPGTGALDIWALLQCLDANGYAGAVGLEYEPRGTSAASLQFLHDARATALFG